MGKRLAAEELALLHEELGDNLPDDAFAYPETPEKFKQGRVTVQGNGEYGPDEYSVLVDLRFGVRELIDLVKVLSGKKRGARCLRKLQATKRQTNLTAAVKRLRDVAKPGDGEAWQLIAETRITRTAADVHADLELAQAMCMRDMT